MVSARAAAIAASIAVDVVAVGDRGRVPAVGAEARGAILGESDRGAGGEGHVVVVVEADQLAELQMAGQRGGFGGDAFHQIAITDQRVGVVVDDRDAVAVVARRQLCLGDRHPDRIAEALAERTGGDLDAGRVRAFGMPRRAAGPLPELLEVVQRQVVAAHVQEAVEQRGAVPGREHEAVAVGPSRIGRIAFEIARPQRVGHRRGAERQAGMAAVGLLNHVDGKKTQGVDALLIE